MKYRVTTVAAILLIAPMTAQAAKYKLALTSQDQQQSRMDNGVQAINSDLPHSSVRVFEVEDPVSKRGELRIYALNASDKPVNIGAECVTMEAGDGTPIQIISYERQVKEEKHRQMWAAIAAGLAAASNNIAASNAGYGYGTVNAYGSNGPWATGTFSTYNAGQAYAAQSLANLQNQAIFNRLGVTSAAAMDALKVNMRTTTVDPGNSFGGQIVYELPKQLQKLKVPLSVLVHVKIGDDVHTFRGLLQKV